MNPYAPPTVDCHDRAPLRWVLALWLVRYSIVLLYALAIVVMVAAVAAVKLQVISAADGFFGACIVALTLCATLPFSFQIGWWIVRAERWLRCKLEGDQ